MNFDLSLLIMILTVTYRWLFMMKGIVRHILFSLPLSDHSPLLLGFFYPEIEFCKVGVIVGAISQSPLYWFSCTLDILLDWYSSTLVSNSNRFESMDVYANFLYWGIMEKKSLWYMSLKLLFKPKTFLQFKVFAGVNVHFALSYSILRICWTLSISLSTFFFKYNVK